MTPTDAPTVAEHDTEQVVLGVDTHADAHVAAVITVMGVLVGTKSFPAHANGYAALLDWARGHGRLRRAGVEGTSSHGTALTRHLRRNHLQVLEANRPDRATRRRRGKTDAIDAENAARAVLSGQATAIAKDGDGAVEMIRLVKIAKDSAVKCLRWCMPLPAWQPSRLYARYHTGAEARRTLAARTVVRTGRDGTAVRVDGLLLEMRRVFEGSSPWRWRRHSGLTAGEATYRIGVTHSI
ncbi:hypothetical protein GCM10009530_39620 [Microbispora corallina]|uniref:Transposase IS110-like N-terminal domain-containing protein n=1 Tax=Microbispora corallina TaxID=83302 RepID=A0ABQ4G8Q5_9ACTN|nr:transposase [Microbispora corallina]GIH43435.1 hypothetical protein Mco01_64350 [Microbispora corallina]